MSPASSIELYEAEADVSPEEYWLYTLIIMERFNRSAREQFVIRQELAASTLLLQGAINDMRWQLEGLKDETVLDFVKRNREPAKLEGNLAAPLPYALLSEDESSAIWDWEDESTLRGRPRDGWKVFRERYPHAGPIISFSRIGFDRLRMQALVEVGVRAHWGVSCGALLLLQNCEGWWKIVKGAEMGLPAAVASAGGRGRVAA